MASDPLKPEVALAGRWRQLVLGVIAMMAISSPQYVWTLFVKPLQATTGASLPTIQVTITILIVLQTWLSPLQGFLIERVGPRLLITIGAGLSGLSWILAAQVTSLVALYLTYGLFAGIGTGFVYIGVVGLMVQWFPDRRGFATGMVAAGYGFGAILTTFPINNMLASSGYQRTLIIFGIILGAVGMLPGWVLRPPGVGAVLPAPPSRGASVVHTPPAPMPHRPIFSLLLVMMTMMSTAGLIAITQFATFSPD